MFKDAKWTDYAILALIALIVVWLYHAGMLDFLPGMAGPKMQRAPGGAPVPATPRAA